MITFNHKKYQNLHFQDTNDKTSYLRGKFLGKVKIFFSSSFRLTSRIVGFGDAEVQAKRAVIEKAFRVVPLKIFGAQHLRNLSAGKSKTCCLRVRESERERERKPFVLWIARVMSRNCGSLMTMKIHLETLKTMETN